MASPFVAGVAGLMLAVSPTLTSAQIEGILHRTARPLPGADFRGRTTPAFGADRSRARASTKRVADASGRSVTMMRLTVFQSGKGDCLLLTQQGRHATSSSTAACATSYREHVAPALGALASDGRGAGPGLRLAHRPGPHRGGAAADGRRARVEGARFRSQRGQAGGAAHESRDNRGLRR